MSTVRRDLSNVHVRPRPVPPERGLRFSGASPDVVHAAHLAAALRRALHATTRNSTQPLAAVAKQAGISYQFLANATLDSSHDQLPIARLPLVLESCDDLTFVSFVADLQDAIVLRRPVPAGDRTDPRRAAAVMREAAEFLETLAGAAEDGVVSPDEFAAADREGREAVEAILQALSDLRARVARPLLERLP